MKSKIFRLLSLLHQRPAEFCDRVAGFTGSRLDSVLHSRPDYQTVDVECGISSLFERQNLNLNEMLGESALARIEERLVQREIELPANAPFARYHNGDKWLGRLCYAVVRALRPRAVTETGVCYGVTSAYLLAALRANNEGHLYSIDLPPL